LPESRWIALVLGTTAVVWSGVILHNVADLPGQTPVSPESLYPTIVTVALLVLWLVPATRTASTWALLAWSALHLVGGGILSVLPIGPSRSIPNSHCGTMHFTACMQPLRCRCSGAHRLCFDGASVGFWLPLLMTCPT